jgi:hypothetical protein
MDKQKSLWGDLSTTDTLRTPFIILKEQSSILTQATQGLLVGDVQRYQDQFNQENFLILQIVAPSLDGYRYSIVEVTHGTSLYPVKVKSLASDDFSRECASETSFEKALGEVLTSHEVRQIVSVLLSDIRAS